VGEVDSTEIGEETTGQMKAKAAINQRTFIIWIRVDSTGKVA
jgi:hypothetical protein